MLFLATANVVETIPQALLDRMELVNLDGYTEDDKIAIARQFLLPRQLERAALTTDEVTVGDDALREIAANYTREPGVRQLERLLAKLLRKAATNFVSATVQPGLVIEAVPRRLPRAAAATAGSTSVRRSPGLQPALLSPVSAATCCSWRRRPWKGPRKARDPAV